MANPKQKTGSAGQADAALVRAFQRGSAEAFSALVTRYMRLIHRETARFGGMFPLEREDLSQEGLVGLLFAARTFSPEGGASFSTYAYRCVENQILSAVRRGTGSKSRVLNDALPLEQVEIRDDSTDPEMLLESREALSGLFRPGRFSEMERRALQLYLSGYRRSELPRVFGAPLSAYDNALARARRKLLQR